MMDEIATVAGMAVALVFLVSALLKLVSPLAVVPLLEATGLTRVPPQFMAFTIAGCEIVCAAAIIAAPKWGLLAAALVLVAFSVVLVVALRADARPRCGCLGDLSVAPTGPVHLGRNAVLVAAVFTALTGPDGRPLTALPAAAALAFLLLVVPEAVEAVREFRTAVREEVTTIFEGGKT